MSLLYPYNFQETWEKYGKLPFDKFQFLDWQESNEIARSYPFWVKRSETDLGVTKERFDLETGTSMQRYEKLRNKVYVDKFVVPMLLATLYSLGWTGEKQYPIAFTNGQAYFVYKNKPNIHKVNIIINNTVSNTKKASKELQSYIMKQDFADLAAVKGDRNYNDVQRTGGKIIDLRDNTAYVGRGLISGPYKETLYTYLENLSGKSDKTLGDLLYLEKIIPLLVNALYDIERTGGYVEGLNLNDFSTNTSTQLFGNLFSGSLSTFPL